MNEELELKKIDEQQFLTTKDKLGYAEEYITLKFNNPKENVLLSYSLSNNLNDIELAILNRTSINVNLKNASWKFNDELSIYVKQLMYKHRVVFSMTTYEENKITIIVINMRVADNWFYTRYAATKKYGCISMGYAETLDKLRKFIENYLKDIEDDF